jgi:hypothetical protein
MEPIDPTGGPSTVAIPADVELEDTILAGLTARQLGILGAAALGVYGLFTATRGVLPLWVFAALAVPVVAGSVALALGRRDGISVDRWIYAALTQWARTRRATPHGDPVARLRRPLTPPQLPGRDVAAAGPLGVIDLGAAGLGVLAVASTVSFTLRTPEEQDALIGVFARYLHALSAPVQILIRAQPLDLSGHVRALDEAAEHLQPPALADAAREHADHLHQLGHTHLLLRRQVVLIVREPPPPGPRRTGPALLKADRAALTRLHRRLTEATELLAPAGISLTTLDTDTASALLRSACHPHTPTTPDDTGPADTELADTELADTELDPGTWRGRPGPCHAWCPGGLPCLPGRAARQTRMPRRPSLASWAGPGGRRVSHRAGWVWVRGCW